MFEEVLSSGRNRDAKSSRAVSFPVAVGLHLGAFGAVVGASMWVTEEAPEPAVPVVFHQAAVPAGPAGSTRSVPASVRPRRVARQVSLVAPRELPTRVGPVAPEADVPGAADLPREGPGDAEGAGGPGPGVPGGTGEQNGPIIDLSGTQPPPGGDFRNPDLVRRVEPAYPEVARRAGLQGLVVLEAIIAASGDVEEIRVVKSAGALLDSAAEDAVRRWKYRPATLNGRAVRVRLSVKVSFRLH
ncbi:MAG TPA: TonB family protein [Thermoanaerobaculia bacterium]|jgi:protein TonB|nr:TonB family protein [Thermoanaerobaculia bacterium]